MTDRHNWEPGASSRIVFNEGGFNDLGLSAYAKSGVPYIEISFRHDELTELDFYEHPEKMLKLMEDNGVKIWAFHLPFAREINPAILEQGQNDFAMDVFTKCILSATKIGIKTIVIHPSAEPNEESERLAKMEKAKQNLKTLSDLCQSHGAVLAVEDLPRTCLGNCSDDIIEFLDAIPELQLCFDTNHLLKQSNEDFLNALIAHKLHGRVRTIHASDYDGIDERHRIPFDGINDWKMIMEKLEELDYEGVFMYEIDKPGGRDIRYKLQDIADNFKELMNL